jgi:hypothetical protein
MSSRSTPQATAQAASEFRRALLRRIPFRVAVLQVDGGSEFVAQFEQACQNRGRPLFVLPPRASRLNGHVERAHRTPNEELYEVRLEDWNVPQLYRQLLVAVTNHVDEYSSLTVHSTGHYSLRNPR